MTAPTTGSLQVVVREANPNEDGAWDAYLASRPPLSPLNRFAWRRVLERAYGVPTHFILAMGAAGRVVGVLPAYETRDLRGRTHFYGLRHGLVADATEVAEALLTHAARVCSRDGATRGLVTSGSRQLTTGFPHTRRTTVVLATPAREEDAWAQLGNKGRNLVRKSRRDGVRVEQGAAGLRAFHDIYARTLARKGVSIHPERFFEEVLAAFGADAELLVASRGARPVAGLLLLFHGGSAAYPYHAALPEARGCAASQALLWVAMRSCAARGVAELDMGESTPGGDVFRFKTNFGGRPREVHYYAVHGGIPPAPRAPKAAPAWRLVGRLVPGRALLRLRRFERARGRLV